MLRLIFNPLSGQFDYVSNLELAAVGSTPNANGASISASQILTLQPADATHPGILTVADWNTFNNKQASGFYITDLTGDATASGPDSAVLTLATVNGDVGSFGSATQVAAFTVNDKGLITAASNIAIQITESQVTNLTTDLSNKVTNPMTTTGDTMYASNTATPATVARLGIGSTGQVLTVVAGIPAWATIPAGGNPSRVWVFGGNGFGSVSTNIRRFSTTQVNTGSDITYADSSTLGGTFTINTTGVYTMTYGEASTIGAYSFGVTNNANSTDVTTNVVSLTKPTVLTLQSNSVASDPMSLCVAHYLTAGDVITAQVDGPANKVSTDKASFEIVGPL